MFVCSVILVEMSVFGVKIDESGITSSSTSQSEGEYNVEKPSSARQEGAMFGGEDPSRLTAPHMEAPTFDTVGWQPDPPAGLQYMNILPVDQGYDSLVERQHNSFSKILPSARQRHQRRRNFIHTKTIGRAFHDEKRLRNAVNSSNYQLVVELLDSGVEPSCIDDKRRTPLHIAAAMGTKPIVELLLERGANPNQKDIIGNTPLHLAACTSHVEVVTLLLQAGTDVNAVDNAGNTPLHLARSRLNILREGGSDKPSTDKLKQEVHHVLVMMKEYMSRSGSDQDILEKLDHLGTQLSKVTTQDDLDQLNVVLTGFANLQIQKKDPA